MSKVNRRPDLAQRVTELERRLVQVDTRPAFDPDIQPGPPTGMTIIFVLREQKERANYFAKFTWNAVTAGACEADIDYYVLQYRAVQGGAPVTGERRTVRLDAKPFIDDSINPYFITPELPRPKRYKWEFRVQVVNKGNIKGPFSSWIQSATVPSQDARPKPPTPTGTAMNFDRLTKSRHVRHRLKVTCDEVGNWDVPGGDNEDDMAYYVFQIRRTDSAGVPLTDASGAQVRRTRKKAAKDEDADTQAFATFNIRNKKHYWQARTRTIDRFNRRSDWSAWTPHARPTDTTPPPAPINAVALSVINGIVIEWEDPPDNEDPEIPDEDVAYYQVQASKQRNFGTIFRKDLYVGGNRKGWRSKDYRQRFWLRVRSVDAAGNKGGWIKRGPVRPLRSKIGKGSTPDIDLLDEEGLELGANPTNSAYYVTAEGSSILRTAFVDGEARDGTLETKISLSSTRARMGALFRGLDSNTYLALMIQSSSTVREARLDKVVAGVVTNLVTWADPAEPSGAIKLDLGSTVELTIVVDHTGANGRTRIRVWINDRQQLGAAKIDHELSASDETTFNQATYKNVGLVTRRGPTTTSTDPDDDGGSYSDWFGWRSQGDPADDGEEYVVDDSFDRDVSTTVLGTADSGQVWTVTGTWGIKGTEHPTALAGSGVILPVLFVEDTATYTGVLPFAPNAPLVREGNHLTIERPTRFVANAIAELANTSNANYGIQFWIVYSVDDGATWSFLGNSQNHFPNDSTRHVHVAMREFYVDASVDAPVKVKLGWAYRTNSDVARNHSLFRQKMTVLTSYSPDFLSPSSIEWSRFSNTRSFYRTTGVSS